MDCSGPARNQAPRPISSTAPRLKPAPTRLQPSASAFGVGTFIGPVLAGGLVTFGLVTPFYTFGIIVAVCAGVIYFQLPEKSPPVQREPGFRMSVADTFKGIFNSLLDRRLVPLVCLRLLSECRPGDPCADDRVLHPGFAWPWPARCGSAGQCGDHGFRLAALFSQLVLVQRFHLSASTLMRFGGITALVSFVCLAFALNYSFLIMAMVLSGLGFGMSRPGHMSASSFAVTAKSKAWLPA